MDLNIDAPLLESLKSGDMPRGTRLLAARAALKTNPLEQLALLVLLSGDQDAEVATLARATVDAIPPASLSVFLERPDVPEAIHVFFSARDGGSVIPTPDAGEAARADETGTDAGGGEAEEGDEPDGKIVMATLTVMERVKLAVKGTREQRTVLVRDPNKMVSAAVMGSPKLTEAEVEGISKMTNVSEDVLRIIANNRSWLRNYAIMANLVRNPKAPIGVSLRLLTRLNSRDIKALARDRNVPDAIRRNAGKMATKQEAGN